MIKALCDCVLGMVSLVLFAKFVPAATALAPSMFLHDFELIYSADSELNFYYLLARLILRSCYEFFSSKSGKSKDYESFLFVDALFCCSSSFSPTTGSSCMTVWTSEELS